MTCEETQRALDSFADGLSSGPEAEEIEQHLASCASCRAELDSMRSLRDSVADLPRYIAPRRDLWPGIAARLAPGPGSPTPVAEGRTRFGKRARNALVAAAAAAVCLVIVGLYRQGGGLGEPGTHEHQTGSLEAELIEADRVYARARDELLAALSVREPRLSPETAQVVRDNLGIIDEAVRETRQALDEDPGNERLARLLIATRQQGIELIRQAVSLPDAS